ncbi:MAG: HlyC/CorC family transporter [Candidatus Tectomicrobia bacterium]|nr:HlyC/CorC family transporter [Candidatus Tectomicrobia bacterium]
MSLLLIVLILLSCLLVQAFFSGAETVVFSSTIRRLKNVEDTTFSFLRESQRLLEAAFIGTHFPMAIAATVMTLFLLPRFGLYGELYAFVLLSPLILLFGELLPKALLSQKTEQGASPFISLLQFFAMAFSPLLTLLTGFIHRIARMITGNREDQELPVAQRMMDLMIDMRGEEIELNIDEKRMIQRIFALGNMTVKEVMVPLIDVAALEDTATTSDVARIVKEKRYTRIPIYNETSHNIIGVVNAYDILSMPQGESRITTIIRPAYYVPESKKVYNLLREVQQKGIHLAIVVDEYGGSIGIVTLEDMLEEIVGEIQDEYDTEKMLYEQLSADEFLVNARMKVDIIAEELQIPLPKGDYETLGGFILHLLERIPEIGETIEVDNFLLSIEEANERSVKKIKIRKIQHI